jgi:hypothetical protein
MLIHGHYNTVRGALRGRHIKEDIKTEGLILGDVLEDGVLMYLLKVLLVLLFLILLFSFWLLLALSPNHIVPSFPLNVIILGGLLGASSPHGGILTRPLLVALTQDIAH